MADMKLFLCIGVLLCLVIGSKSETSDVFKGVVEPVVEQCEGEVNYTDEDLNSVLNLEEPFSQAAKCLIDCGMTKLNMIRDGQVTPPEEYVVKYKEMYADLPERMENPDGVVQTCYDEVSAQEITAECEVGIVMLQCTSREVYGAK